MRLVCEYFAEYPPYLHTKIIIQTQFAYQGCFVPPPPKKKKLRANPFPLPLNICVNMRIIKISSGENTSLRIPGSVYWVRSNPYPLRL